MIRGSAFLSPMSFRGINILKHRKATSGKTHRDLDKRTLLKGAEIPPLFCGITHTTYLCHSFQCDTSNLNTSELMPARIQCLPCKASKEWRA